MKQWNVGRLECCVWNSATLYGILQAASMPYNLPQLLALPFEEIETPPTSLHTEPDIALASHRKIYCNVSNTDHTLEHHFLVKHLSFPSRHCMQWSLTSYNLPGDTVDLQLQRFGGRHDVQNLPPR